MGITVALSTCVFIYFNAVGFKNQGFWGYIKSFYGEEAVTED